jgi:hypothetical protein
MEDGDGQGTSILGMLKRRRSNQIARFVRFGLFMRRRNELQAIRIERGCEGRETVGRSSQSLYNFCEALLAKKNLY